MHRNTTNCINLLINMSYEVFTVFYTLKEVLSHAVSGHTTSDTICTWLFFP